ncbi:MAG: class I SAM-dependent methyltransferase [Phycisphaerae bacterium]|jgi:SAM-dependent methyltransferase
MTTLVADPLVRRYGKPLDYTRLGKSFHEGAEFMRHMAAAARELSARAARESAFVKVEICPVCGSGRCAPRFEHQGFEYRQCERPDCRHAFVANRIPEAWRTEFFRSDERYSRVNYCDARRAALRVDQIARPKVEHVLEHAEMPQGAWLDVGCGAGEVLAVLRDFPGWTAVGLELSARDAAFGRERFGVDIREQLLSDFARLNPHERFDVVSLLGVLHCVPRPLDLLRDATAALRPGGILAAELTNFDALTCDAVRSFPDHPTRSSFNGVTTLHQFTRDSARRAFEFTGLAPESVWFYGGDLFEILNQWFFSDERLADSPLAQSFCESADALQRCFDERERSSNMFWIARNPA